MTTKTNQPQQDKNKDFGLPQVEFKPIAAGGGKWFKITTIVAGFVLIMGAGIVYWFFYHSPSIDPSMKAHPMLEKREGGALASDVDFIDEDTPARQKPTEQGFNKSTLAKEMEMLQSAEHAACSNAPQAVQPEKGGITSINTPRGYYYVIVGSFIDDDLASDYAHRLAQKGIQVMLIAPPQGQYCFRVAIEQEDTFRNAYEKAEALKAVYGTDTWVMKY
jgi:hypothetical protein